MDHLKAMKEVAHDLIIAGTVLALLWISEEGTEFVSAEGEAGFIEGEKDVVVAHIDGDAQLTENDVVVNSFFGNQRCLVFLTSVFYDEAVEESGQQLVVDGLKSRVVVTFEPVADFGTGSGPAAKGKKLHHAVVVEIEDVAYPPEDVVVVHGAFSGGQKYKFPSILQPFPDPILPILAENPYF